MKILATLLALLLPIAAAAQGPRLPVGFSNQPAATHFVTSGGSAVSNCTVGDPCSLPRAFEIASTTIACGSRVNVANGSYTQSELVYGASQVCAAEPVRFFFNDAAIITGLEEAPVVANFTNTSGQVWEIAWDEASKFTVGLVANKNPTNWTPITVRDAGNVQFEIEKPINYTKRASIAEVEKHRCTFYHDTAANKVYVHMCHNGAPTTADDLYFGRSRYGQMIIQGDGLELINPKIHHASLDLGVGILVEPTAARTIIRGIELRSATAEIGGVNTLFERFNIYNVITQGPSAAGCDDEDSGTLDEAAKSCFNTNAQGTGLYLGVSGNPASTGQIARNGKIHRNWNGMSLFGANTLTRSVLWGHPNHSFTWNGTGGVVSHSISCNAQDSLSANLGQWDQTLFENNILCHDVVAHISYQQEVGDPPWTPTTSWTFRNNILAYLLIEDLTSIGLSMSCNVFIEDMDGSGVDVASLDGAYGSGSVFSYSSYAAFEAGQPSLATNSAGLGIAKWTDGTQFKLFTAQSSPFFDFTPVAGAQALGMHSSCGQAGPIFQVPIL